MRVLFSFWRHWRLTVSWIQDATLSRAESYLTIDVDMTWKSRRRHLYVASSDSSHFMSWCITHMHLTCSNVTNLRKRTPNVRCEIWRSEIIHLSITHNYVLPIGIGSDLGLLWTDMEQGDINAVFIKHLTHFECILIPLLDRVCPKHKE